MSDASDTVLTAKATVGKIRTNVNLIFSRLIENKNIIEKSDQIMQILNTLMTEGLMHHKKTMSNLTVDGKRLR